MAHGVMVVVMLLFAASLAAVFFKKINFPYTIGLVVVGIIMSFCCSRVGIDTSGIRLTPELIMYILLPALIFESAVHIDTRSMMRNIVPTLVLAAPGLVISTLIVGAMMFVTTPLNIVAAMLFGALISATDPVAVIALFKEVGAPKRLAMLVDGESLFNDATAIVMFNIIRGIAFSGIAVGFATCVSGAFDFLLVFFAGLLVGAAVGGIMIVIIARVINEPLLQISLSTIVAYTAFIIADKVFGVSGVMSAVGAGVVISYYGNTHFNAEVKQYMEQFWSFASFAANSFIFLMLGFTQEIMFADIAGYKPMLSYIGYAILAITAARAIVVFGLCPIIGMIRERDTIDWKYQTVIFWGGLRGAVPMALVLSLPENFPSRELLISITLGVILFTLLIQGTTIAKMMHFFRIDEPDSATRSITAWVRMIIATRVIERLKRWRENGLFPADMIDSHCVRYQEERERREREIAEYRDKAISDLNASRRNLWLEVLAVAGQAYREMAERSIINPVTYRELLSITERHRDIVMESDDWIKLMFDDGFDFRLERWLFRRLHRHCGNNTLCRMMLRRMLSSDLEKAYAIRFAAERINKTLDIIAGFMNDRHEMLDECRDYYGTLIVRLEHLAERIKKIYPEEAAELSGENLCRFVCDAELTELRDLAHEGLAPEAVTAVMTEDISARLLQSIRKVVS